MSANAIRFLAATVCIATFTLQPVLAGAGTYSAADTTRKARVDTQFKFYPSPIWGRTAGFSAGVGYQIDNLLFPGSRILATAKPGQYLGRYTLTFFAKDAFRSPLYGLANVYYETTGHQWFYGIGPASSSDDLIAVERHMVEAEARIGAQPLGRSFFIQPVLKYVHHEVEGFESEKSGAVERLSEASRRTLEISTEQVFEGIGYGLDAGIDFRDNPQHPRQGLLIQGYARRYDFGRPDWLAYDQFGISAYAYLPLGDNRLALRAVTQLTEHDDDVTVPFFFLPSLHGRLLPGYSWDRFFGDDLLALQAELAVPMFDIFNWAAMDALVSFGAANVYDDIGKQFRPSITFDKDLDGNQDSYALRPSAAIGLQLESFTRYNLDLRVLLGWGTDGARLVRFGFVQDLRDIELNSR